MDNEDGQIQIIDSSLFKDTKASADLKMTSWHGADGTEEGRETKLHLRNSSKVNKDKELTS